MRIAVVSMSSYHPHWTRKQSTQTVGRTLCRNSTLRCMPFPSHFLHEPTWQDGCKVLLFLQLNEFKFATQACCSSLWVSKQGLLPCCPRTAHCGRLVSAHLLFSWANFIFIIKVHEDLIISPLIFQEKKTMLMYWTGYSKRRSIWQCRLIVGNKTHP